MKRKGRQTYVGVPTGIASQKLSSFCSAVAIRLLLRVHRVIILCWHSAHLVYTHCLCVRLHL